jgi:hypothetical protein
VETQKTQNKYNTIDIQRMCLWSGAIVLVIDSIVLISCGEFDFAIAVGTFLGLIIISMNLWPYIGMQQPSKDERAARIGGMAGLYSWYITLFLTVIGTMILGYLPESWNVHPTLAQGLGGVIIVMVVTMLALYEVMGRKSDVG